MNKLCVLVLCASLLAACGGGGADSPPPPVAADNQVPAGARASVTAFVQFLLGLKPDDTGEPLDVEGLVPPTSETEEPADIG